MVSSGNAAGGNHFLPSGRPERRERLQFETLEIRTLMSADGLTFDASAGADAAALDAVMATTQVTALATTPTSPVSYTPAQIAAAYGFNQVKFGNVVGNGAGQTIAIVDAYDDPDIAADLQAFDKQFGLANPKFTEVKQTVGGKGPATDAGWAMEISLDVEWAHAMAPGANIELVEANTASLGNLLASVQYAAAQPGVSVVSMSWGASEFSGETNYNSYFTTPAGHTGVSFVASSGDSGAGALWPAISTNVLSVGGTTLTLNKNGTYGGETAWSGSGGGASQYQTEASYEKGVQTTGKQMDPDVSYDANPNTGFDVYDSVAYNGSKGWWAVGGTSAGAPQWAALVAIANQGRALNHQNSLTNAAAAVFSISANDFHDVTSGNDGGHSAGAGYDEVTGLGTPQVSLVVQGLLGVTAAQQTYTNVAASSPSTSASSATHHADLGGFDDSATLVSVGVTFTQAIGTNPANAAVTGAVTSGTAVPIGSMTASLTVGGREATPRSFAATRAAASALRSSGGGMSTGSDESDAFDSTVEAPTTSAGVMAVAQEQFSAKPVGGTAASLDNDSIVRVDASFADDSEWMSAQWIDGQPAVREAFLIDGYATEENAEAGDAEAEQLSAVLLAVGAVLTTMRSGDAAVSQTAADQRQTACCGTAD